MGKQWPFDEKTMESIRKAFEDVRIKNEQEAETFWNSLTYEDKCNAFHAVTSRLFEGELKEQRSYRGMLYDVFGFGEEMYGRGMDCGYMALHNCIIPLEEQMKE